MARDPSGGNLFTFRFVREPPGTLGLEITLGKLADQIGDFKKWGAGVAAAFYEVERTVFETEGARILGRPWAPLSPAYARRKRERWGNQPILVASGRMRESLTEPPRGSIRGKFARLFTGGSDDAVLELTRTSLTIGTAVPYSAHHQFARPSKGKPTGRKRRPMLAAPESYVLVMTERGVETLEEVMADTVKE